MIIAGPRALTNGRATAGLDDALVVWPSWPSSDSPALRSTEHRQAPTSTSRSSSSVRLPSAPRHPLPPHEFAGRSCVRQGVGATERSSAPSAPSSVCCLRLAPCRTGASRQLNNIDGHGERAKQTTCLVQHCRPSSLDAMQQAQTGRAVSVCATAEASATAQTPNPSMREIASGRGMAWAPAAVPIPAPKAQYSRLSDPEQAWRAPARHDKPDPQPPCLVAPRPMARLPRLPRFCCTRRPCDDRDPLMNARSCPTRQP